MSWIILKGKEGYYHTNSEESLKNELGQLVLKQESFTVYKVEEIMSVSLSSYADSSYSKIRGAGFVQLIELFFKPNVSTETKNDKEK